MQRSGGYHLGDREGQVRYIDVTAIQSAGVCALLGNQRNPHFRQAPVRIVRNVTFAVR